MLFLIVILTLAAVASSSTDLDADKSRLLSSLLSDYNKFIEPSNSQLRFSLAIFCARGGRNGEPMLTSVVEKYQWVDHRLVWNPELYSGVDQLEFPDTLVWKPDMKLYNSLTASESRDPCNVNLNHNGTIIWFPRALYQTYCSQGRCIYDVGLWTYDSPRVPIGIWEFEPVGVYYDNLSCPLKLTSASAEVVVSRYDCCNSPYSRIHFKVTYAAADADDDDDDK